MKDDFYKDMKHKRAQDEKSSKTSAGNKKSEKQNQETLSRSARHKTKEAGENKQPAKKVPPKKHQQKENNFTDKLKGYFSAENAAKGKAIFLGTFSSYQSRIKNELKISKEKLGALGAAKKADKKPDKKENGRKKRMLPWVLAILILIPITVLFAFLIFSNFWPSLNDEIQLADENTSEETAENSGTEEDGNGEKAFNEELEAQKAEHEKRLAENRNEDLTAKNIETDYSQEELKELEEAALSAIRSKEDGTAEKEAAAEKAKADKEKAEADRAAAAKAEAEADAAALAEAEADAAAKAEAEEETETADENADTEEDSDSKTKETQNANASHVVTTQDNLYRIAIQYYGDGSAENVQRIMEANGVTPDSLSVGQELIIP